MWMWGVYVQRCFLINKLAALPGSSFPLSLLSICYLAPSFPSWAYMWSFRQGPAHEPTSPRAHEPRTDRRTALHSDNPIFVVVFSRPHPLPLPSCNLAERQVISRSVGLPRVRLELVGFLCLVLVNSKSPFPREISMRATRDNHGVARHPRASSSLRPQQT